MEHFCERAFLQLASGRLAHIRKISDFFKSKLILNDESRALPIQNPSFAEAR